MNTSRAEKSCLFQTNFTYSPTQKPNSSLTSSRTFSKIEKENVVPCAGQMQTFISILNQKKYELKNLIIQKQKYDELTVEQSATLDTQSIKQSFEVEKQVQLLRQNTRILDEVQSVKKQKLKHMQKLLSVKKCLESRFQQIVQMKRLFSQTQQQNMIMQERLSEIQVQSDNLVCQNNNLDLMSQALDNEVFQMKQTVRQSEVQVTTTQSALNMFKDRIEGKLLEIKDKNKQGRTLNLQITENGDKVKRRREEATQNDINSHQLMIKNKQIESINIKLRSDLEKCKGHLHCLLKNNEILGNSIQEFTYVDTRVTKLINRNELKRL